MRAGDQDALIERVEARSGTAHVQRHRLREDVEDLQRAVIAIRELRAEVEMLRKRFTPGEVPQAALFDVLCDRVEEQGRIDTDVRVRAASELWRLKLAGPWHPDGDETWALRQLGGRRVAFIERVGHGGGIQPYRWRTTLPDYQSARGSADTLQGAQDAVGEDLCGLGFLMVSDPLDALCAELCAQGEWPGFIEDMRHSSHPEESYPEVASSWGHVGAVRRLLEVLGYRP